MAARLLEPYMTFHTANGVSPLSGGKISFFVSESVSTLKDTFSDDTLLIANTNPLILDSAGRVQVDVWGDGEYKMEVADSSGTPIDTFDPVAGGAGITKLTDLASLTALTKASLTTGDVFDILFHTASGDEGGGRFEWDSADTAAANGGTIVASDEGGNGRWTRNITSAWTTAWFGVTADASTDNTVAVQAALDAAVGVDVKNPLNSFFDLSALLFADGNFGTNLGRYALIYTRNDDISDAQHPGQGVTGEFVRFTQNNNTAGYVNERESNSGYSTGDINNVRRDVDAPAIGAGQDIRFGRTSYVHRQDGRNRIQMKFTTSNLDGKGGLDDGYAMQWFEFFNTLGGIDGTPGGTFTTGLALDDLVEGTTSGALGLIRVIGVGDITVEWQFGDFVVGETLILSQAGETSTDTITSVSTITQGSRQAKYGHSIKNAGNGYFDTKPDQAVHPLTVGGTIGGSMVRGQVTATTADLILADNFLISDRLNGIDNASFAATLAVGDTLTGNTSDARGVVRKINTGSVDIQLRTGTFAVAENVTLVSASETSSTTISSVHASGRRARVKLDDVTGKISLIIGSTANAETNTDKIVAEWDNSGGASLYQTDVISALANFRSAIYFLVDTSAVVGSSPKLITGTGSPEGVEAAGPGSRYTNLSGGSGTSLFVKETGTGNTGWIGK